MIKVSSEKNLKDFLITLKNVTEANLRFLDGICSLPIDTEEYLEEIKKIQNLINSFEFVMRPKNDNDTTQNQEATKAS